MEFHMTKTNDKTESFDLSDAEKRVQRDLASAKETRDELLKSLALGQDVQSQLDAIDEEIEQHERAQKRFAEAKRVAAAANTASAKQAAHDQALAQLADAVLGAEALAELATGAIKTLATLKVQLDAIEEQRTKVYATLTNAARDAYNGAPHSRVADDLYQSLYDVVGALTAPRAYLAGLAGAGIGTRGIHVDHGYVNIRPAFVTPSPDASDAAGEAANEALVRLRAVAEKIADWSAKAHEQEAA
jgi:DNA repair exonuclease SbcCD ATPase subunit